MSRSVLPATFFQPVKRKISKKEIEELAAGFARRNRLGTGPDPGGVPKDVWPKMITATADALAARSKSKKRKK